MQALQAGQLTSPEVKKWALFIHLEQYAGWVVPIAGWVLPIVLWQMKRNEHPELDAHGKEVANWLISELINTVVAFVLCFVLIGSPILIAIAVIGLIFPLIGAVKSQDGRLCAIR
jgi:uncharacterized protein